MKKNVFLMAAAATMFAACSQTDLVNEIPEKAPKAIEFENGFVNNTTRAENSEEGYLQTFSDYHDNFSVWGFKYGEDDKYSSVFSGDEVTVANGKYTPEIPAYWDREASYYTFYAVAPSNDIHTAWEYNAPNSDTDVSYFTTSIKLYNDEVHKDMVTRSHVLKSTGDGHYNQDLMLSENVKVDDPATISEAVQLNFYHILSRLNVVVNNTNENFRLFKVSIKNLPSSGDFNENADLGDDVLKNGTAKRWSNQGDPATFESNFGNDGTEIDGSKIYVMQTLVVPQLVNYEATITNQPYIEVEYGYTTSTPGQYDKFTRQHNLADVFGYNNDAKGKVLPFYEGWENTLTLNVKSDVISFAASVATWDELANGSHTVQ